MQEEIKIEKIIPCLPAQHGFLVDSEAGSSGIYKQQITVLVDQSANLSSDALEDNIRRIQKHCDILRTVFDWSTGKEMQVILSGIPPRISLVSGDIEQLQAAATDELIRLDTISDEPPVRFLIATIGNELYLTITYHHILFDGPSITMLLDSIISFSGRYPDKDSTSGYLQWLSSNISDQDRQFWKNILLTLPDEDVDVFGNARGGSSERSVKRRLSEHASSTLLKLAKQYKVSVATLVQAICSEWLVGYFNKPIVYGSVLSTREFEINDDYLGPFINTVPIQISTDITSGNLRDTAIRVQEQSMSMSRAKHVPLRDIAGLVPSHSLFFGIILTITTTPVRDSKGLYKVIWTHENTGFPLSIDIDVTQPISISFTSVLDRKNFDAIGAIQSFVDYCSKRILDQKEPVHIDSYTPLRIEEKAQQQTISIRELIKKVAKVLDVDGSTIDDQKSFLLNGGDSILALKLKNELGLDRFTVAVGQIIRKDSLLELAEEVVPGGNNNKSITPATKSTLCIPDAVSYILNAYELGYEKDYHEQAAFYIEGDLDIGVFSEAVSGLVNETTSLNLSYSLRDMLATTDRRSPRLELHHIENVPKDLDSFVNDVSSRDLEKAFDPRSGSLLRFYVSIANDGWYLFLSFSALVTDGWSFSALLERLFVIYSNLLNNVQVETRTDNLLAAFPLMVNNATDDIPQKDPAHDTVTSHTFKLSRQESDRIRNRANSSRMTQSQYFEKAVASLVERFDARRVLVYESGRDIDMNVSTTVGPFSYLRQVIVSEISNNLQSDFYYVYENYPRESENRLREDKIGEFKERGVWRRPLLPPTASIGIVVDVIDGSYLIDILIRSGTKNETTSKRVDDILNSLKEELR